MTKTPRCIRCNKIFKTELKCKNICPLCIKPHKGNGIRHKDLLSSRIHKHREYLLNELKRNNSQSSRGDG